MQSLTVLKTSWDIADIRRGGDILTPARNVSDEAIREELVRDVRSVISPIPALRECTGCGYKGATGALPTVDRVIANVTDNLAARKRIVVQTGQAYVQGCPAQVNTLF